LVFEGVANSMGRTAFGSVDIPYLHTRLGGNPAFGNSVDRSMLKALG